MLLSQVPKKKTRSLCLSKHQEKIALAEILAVLKQEVQNRWMMTPKKSWRVKISNRWRQRILKIHPSSKIKYKSLTTRISNKWLTRPNKELRAQMLWKMSRKWNKMEYFRDYRDAAIQMIANWNFKNMNWFGGKYEVMRGGPPWWVKSISITHVIVKWNTLFTL